MAAYEVLALNEATPQIFAPGSGNTYSMPRALAVTGGLTLDANATLHGDASNVLALRNGINGQALRIYNTYTDASNYERAEIKWVSNIFEIGAIALGTGTKRATVISGYDKSGSYAPVIELAFHPNATHSKSLQFTNNGGGEVTWGTSTTKGTYGTAYGSFGVSGCLLGSGTVLGFSNNGIAGLGPRGGFARAANGVVRVVDASSTDAGALEMGEQTAPSAPSTNSVRIYAEDNGSGKTRLMALFPTGAAQQIAIEP